MGFTKLYLTNVAAGYTPATLRGAWDDTASAVTKALDPRKELGGAVTVLQVAETNAADDYDVLLYRGVSAPLAAQTINCNLDVVIAVEQRGTDSPDLNYHLHVYATTGDSDTPRVTLLSDYAETGAAWPGDDTKGRALASAQAVNQTISAGDRLVVEIGFVNRTASATSQQGRLGYGTVTTTDGVPLADLEVDAVYTAGAGFISFSASIDEQDYTAQVAQVAVRTLSQDAAPTVRVAQVVVRTLSPNPGGSASPSPSSSPSPSLSESRSTSTSGSASESRSGSASYSPSASESGSGSASASGSKSASESRSGSPTNSPSPSSFPADIWVTQLAAESLTTKVSALRVSQLQAEAISTYVAPLRLSQTLVETITDRVVPLRVTQTLVEVISRPTVYLRPRTPSHDRRRYIRRVRQSPHLSDEQLWVYISSFQLDLETGRGLRYGQGLDPQIMLQWSDDGGHTWSDERWVSAGVQGAYAWRAIWRRLGRSRDRVWRVAVSDPVPWRLLDAYVAVEKGTS